MARDNSQFQPENQKRPKLTASERRMIAELDRVRALVGDGEDAQAVAKDEGYALTRRYFDAKANDYKPRFKKLLDKLKLKTRAKGNNPLLRIAEYLSGGKMKGAKKTRFAQSLAACVYFSEKWTALVAHYEGHESKAIRAWKEDAGLLKPREPKPPERADKAPGRELGIEDRDVPEAEIEAAVKSGDRRVAIVTFLPGATCYLHRILPADDPHTVERLTEKEAAHD